MREKLPVLIVVLLLSGVGIYLAYLNFHKPLPANNNHGLIPASQLHTPWDR